MTSLVKMSLSNVTIVNSKSQKPKGKLSSKHSIRAKIKGASAIAAKIKAARYKRS